MNSRKEGAKEFKISRSTAGSITEDICNTPESFLEVNLSFRIPRQQQEKLPKCVSAALHQSELHGKLIRNEAAPVKKKPRDSLARVCQTTLKGQ